MMIATRSVLIFGVLLLSACTSPNDIIKQHGQPDMVYESAGDLGRYYLVGQPVEHVWRWDQKTLYYVPEDQAYFFVDGYLGQKRPLNHDERTIYEELLRGLAVGWVE